MTALGELEVPGAPTHLVHVAIIETSGKILLTKWDSSR